MLAEGVLEGRDELQEMPLPSGRAAFVERLEEILGTRIAPAETAPKPLEESPAERLRQDFVTQLGERLLDLEVCPAADGRETVLAVVEPGLASDSVRAQLAVQVGEHFGETPPQLELIDPTTWAAVQRLVEAGVLQQCQACFWPPLTCPRSASPKSGDQLGNARGSKPAGCEISKTSSLASISCGAMVCASSPPCRPM